MKRGLLCLMSMSLVSSLAVAVEKNDFAYGYSLEVDGDGAIYSLTLPQELYQGITRHDRGDVRVFNGRGEPVPHLIRREERKEVIAQPEVALAHFPLYSAGEGKSVAQSVKNVRITTNEQGSVIDLNYGKADIKVRKLIGYLLDASALEQVPNALTLSWPETQTDFVLNVLVEGSDDLNHWQTLTASATLSYLHYGNHKLVQQRITMPMRKVKYLRLTWEKDKVFTLDKMLAQFPESITAQPRQWTMFTEPVKALNTQKEVVYAFDTKSLLPVDRIRLTLPQRNTVIQAVLESSADKAGPWSVRYADVIYDMQIEGAELTTPDIITGLNNHRYWQLRLIDKEVNMTGLPILKLGWVPEQLLFIAQGEGPFTLAFGSAQVDAVTTPLGKLLNQDNLANNGQLIKAAQLGSRVQLGDAAKLQPAPPPLPWKKWLLWAILVVGVMVLAAMALKLSKQMNQGNPPAA